MDKVTTNKERDTLAAFAGLVVLLAALAVIFSASAPSGSLPIVAVANTEIPPSSTPLPTEPPTVALEPTATIQPTELPSSTPLPVAESTSESTEAATASNASSTTYDPAVVARGQEIFVTCTACHGPDARGITGLGKDLVTGEFALTTSDADLVIFITTGRPIWDAANTTGVDMPSKGGNPTLTEEDIAAVVAYIRTLQNP